MNRLSKVKVGWIAMGFTSMVAQIVLMRELMVVFYGNEISLGVILANWLLWTGLGSFVLGRFVDRIRSRLSLLVLCFMVLSLLLPLLIIGVRGARLFWGISIGEIVGFAPMFCTSFVILAPICVLCGFLFALNCRIVDLTFKEAVSQIGRVYIFEAIGSAIGGTFFSYVLIRYLNHLEIAAIVGTIDLGVALFLSLGRKTVLKWIGAILFVSYVASSWLYVDWAEQESNRLRWRGFELVHSQESRYGNIAVTSLLDQKSFYENGLLIFSFPDVFSAEEAVQFALLEHPAPRTVLLIGGGASDCLSEILKHGISRVDYVELDPQIVRLSRKLLPVTSVLEDPRVEIIHTDGRFFVKMTKDRYDCVILNLPDPFTAQLNRFYTLQFFREVNRILNPGGVFSFRVSSAENYIGKELGRFLSSVHLTLGKVFEEGVVIPGENNIFIATNARNLLTLDPETLVRRLKERDVTTRYIREYYLPYRMSLERVEYLASRIEDWTERVNTDFHPISYYYSIVLWSTHFQTFVRKVLTFFSLIDLKHLLLAAVGLAILTLALRRRYRSLPVLFAVGTTGSAEIIMEVVCMLGFQVLYGFVYSRVGVITAAFMIGLTSGSVLMVRLLRRRLLGLGHLGLIQIAVCMYPLLLVASFQLFSRALSPSMLLSIEILFPLLTFFAGFVGGLQFPLASKLYLETGREVGRVAGMVYGIDLFGACIGAVFASTLLIPVLGIFQTCYLVAAFNLVSILLIGMSWRDQSRLGESS